MKLSNKTKFIEDKISLKQYVKVYSGVKMPWIFFIGMYALEIIIAKTAIYMTSFTGEMLDASGVIPQGELVSYILTSIINCVLVLASALCTTYANNRVVRGVQSKMWSKILYIPQRYYDTDSGEHLVSRITQDCLNSATIFSCVIWVFTALQQFWMYLVEMLGINRQIAMWVLIVIPVGAALTWLMCKLQGRVVQRTQAMLSDATNYLIERTENLLLIKACDAQELEIAKGEAEFEKQYRAQLYAGWVDILNTVVVSIVSLLSQMIPFIAGSILVSRNVMTSGDVVMMYTYSNMVSLLWMNAGSMLQLMAAAISGLAKVSDVMNVKPENLTDGAGMDCGNEDIIFDNVSFAYQEGTPVLKNVSCTIPQGKVTAIIGANGSGKSTMFKLIDRLYGPDEGAVRFGKTDAKEYRLEEWRRSFSLVAQDCPVMAGTIRDNITYGCRRRVTEEELVEVSKQAKAYDFISALPDGFDTEVAPGGANFSGGQCQKLAIARALMSSPDYLLLDEATSNLDAKSENEITQALNELMTGRTTVIIAHSLAAIRRADNVIVLRDGQVETTGSPKEILKTTDNYLARVMARHRS